MSGFTDVLAVPVGGAPFAVTAAGNAPAGCELINRADHGGTLWVRSGASGSAVPLPPGASVKWADTAALPYVQLDPAATAPESLIVTNQLTDYTNPEAVAAATATQLAAQGVPSVFLGQTLYASAAVDAPGVIVAGLDVSGFASLVIIAAWNNREAGAASALRLDYALPPAPGSGSPGAVVTQWLTQNTATDMGTSAWRVPVLGPTLTLTGLGTGVTLTVYGTNRAAERIQQIDPGAGGTDLETAASPTAGTVYPLTLFTDAGSQGSGVQPNGSRLNGAVSISVTPRGYAAATFAGTVQASWVVPTTSGTPGVVTAPVVAVTTPAAGAGSVPLVNGWAHPPVPVNWSWIPNVTTSGGRVQVRITSSP